MGFGVYWMAERGQFAGYEVPAICEHPDCTAKINRGLGCRCNGKPAAQVGEGDDMVAEEPCGRFFCGQHGGESTCARCAVGGEPYPIKPDIQEWIDHLLTDKTWRRWRAENEPWVSEHRAFRVSEIRARYEGLDGETWEIHNGQVMVVEDGRAVLPPSDIVATDRELVVNAPSDLGVLLAALDDGSPKDTLRAKAEHWEAAHDEATELLSQANSTYLAKIRAVKAERDAYREQLERRTVVTTEMAEQAAIVWAWQHRSPGEAQEITPLQHWRRVGTGQQVMLETMKLALTAALQLPPAPAGADRILTERCRQIEKGYTPDHDAGHGVAELLDAAVAYIRRDPELWPWSTAQFTPHDDWQDLARAGALLAAAIDSSPHSTEVDQ